MSIKAVVFDYGGVISLPQDEAAQSDLAEIAGIDEDLMRRIYWENRSIYDRGLVTGEQYFRDILANCGVFPDGEDIARMVRRDCASWSRINPETEKLMADLRAAGFKIGILSNIVKPFLAFALDEIPVFKVPDAAVFSCEVDAVKPEEKIYRILCEALGCAADEIVFFDDTVANVEGAEKFGIHAFHWRDADDARKQLSVLCAGRF